MLKELIEIGVKIHASVPHIARICLLALTLNLVVVDANHCLDNIKYTSLFLNDSVEEAGLYKRLRNCSLSFTNELYMAGFTRGQLDPPMMLS